MDAVSLTVEHRDVLRKKVKALRRSGMIPIHLYGRDMQSMSLQAPLMSVSKVIRQVGHNIPLYLTIEGSKEQNLVFVREVQHHPVTNQLLHVDFYRVDASRRIVGEVPIALMGEAPAVRVHRGVLMQTLHQLSVECLPMEMPERVEIDISGLEEFDQGIRVSDFVPGQGITVLTDPEELIVRVSAPRIAEEQVQPDALVEETASGQLAETDLGVDQADSADK